MKALLIALARAIAGPVLSALAPKSPEVVLEIVKAAGDAAEAEIARRLAESSKGL